MGWRENFNAGRALVREAAARGRETPEAAPVPGPEAGQEESLRALLGEVAEIAEQSQARNAELETELTAIREFADALTEAMQSPGMKTLLVKQYAPDAHAKASEAEKVALNACMQNINVAYDLIERRAENRREAA